VTYIVTPHEGVWILTVSRKGSDGYLLDSTWLLTYKQISSVSQPGEIPAESPESARQRAKFFIPLRHILESSKKIFPLLFSTSPEKLLDNLYQLLTVKVELVDRW